MRLVLSNKEVLLHILYVVLITSYFAFFVTDYSYPSFYLIFYFLSFYITGYNVIRESFQNGLVSVRQVFNVFGVLYGNFYIAECIYKNFPISENCYFAMLLLYVAILSFNVCYLLTSHKSSFFNRQQCYRLNLRRFNLGLVSLMAVSLLAVFYIVFIKVGLVAYFAASRAEQSLMRSDYSLLLFYPYTLPLISSASLYLYLEYRKKFNLFLFVVSFSAVVFEAIISASRGSLLFVLLPSIFLLNKYKIISNRSTAIVAVLGFCLFGIWKSLYSEEIEVQYDSEFVTWYKICDRLLSLPEGVPYFYGRTYLETIYNLIVPITNTEALSEWYVRKYEFDVWASGGGRGFPSVFEAYLNFNIFGVIFVYGFYGVLIKKLDLKSDLGVFLYLIIMVSIYKLFRAPAYSFWKNIMWFQVYPLLILWYFSRVRMKIKINH